MPRSLKIFLISGFVAVIFFACQNSEQGRKLINLRLDDSLGVSNYDSLRIEILNANDSVLGNLFSGPYRPDSSHMLRNLVLPDGTPTNYTLRITVYKSGIILLEIELLINQALASRPVITFRGSLDSIPPTVPALSAASPVKSPLWTWTAIEPRISYEILLTQNGIPYDSVITTLTQYSPDTSLSLSDGFWFLKVVAIDSVGNRSLPSTRPIFVDNTDPKFGQFQPIANARITAIDPIISGTASDTSGIRKLTYRLNSGAFDSLPRPTSNWVMPRISLPTGQSTLTITAFDSAGNSIESTLTIYKWPNVVFVCQNGIGTGDSWEDCNGELDSAMRKPQAQQPGYQIWLSEGRYHYPNSYISQGTGGIYGGFQLTSKFFADRNHLTRVTWLFSDSIHRNVDGNNDDFTIDGFSVQDPNSFLDASYISGNLRIQNCEFSYFEDVPPISVPYNPVLGSLFIKNCRFLDNRSVTSIISLKSMEEVFIDSCLFQRNSSGDSMGVISVEAKVFTILNSKFYDVSNVQIVYNAPFDYRRFEVTSCEIRGGRNSILTRLTSYIYTNNLDL